MNDDQRNRDKAQTVDFGNDLARSGDATKPIEPTPLWAMRAVRRNRCIQIRLRRADDGGLSHGSRARIRSYFGPFHSAASMIDQRCTIQPSRITHEAPASTKWIPL